MHYRSKICFALLSLVLTAAASAKVPPSPLYRYQHWARNNGREISLSRDSREYRPYKYTTSKGIDLNLEPAWDISTGAKSVVIGVIDQGFSLNHRNLSPNFWRNPGEVGFDSHGMRKESNGADDDKNGYVDDVNGFSFSDNTAEPHSCNLNTDRLGRSTLDCEYWHGNGLLGIIGARPDPAFGIAGINWNVSMMLLKTNAFVGVGADRIAEAANTAKAIRYAADNGAKIICWSGFVENADETRKVLLRQAFWYAKQKGVLLVVAAGNSYLDLDVEGAKAPYPMSEDFDNVIYVANVDPHGKLSHWERRIDGELHSGGSNYGKRVFIAAPAEDAITTLNVINGQDAYTVGGGTSDAAPMVAGVAALILSVNPSLDYAGLKQVLQESAKKLATLKGKLFCEGIPDAAAALRLAEHLRR